MKNQAFLFLLTISLLTACSTGQANALDVPLQAKNDAPPAQPTINSVLPPDNLTATDTAMPVATFTPKPPLALDAWKQMPPGSSAGDKHMLGGVLSSVVGRLAIRHESTVS